MTNIYEYSNPGQLLALLEEFLVLVIVLLPIIIICLVIYVIGLWKLFKKAGRNGWEALIPFYNICVLGEISGIAWYYPLIIIISNLNNPIIDYIASDILPLARLISYFFIYYNLSKRLGKTPATALLLTLFPYIMIPIIGISKSYQYDDSIPCSENGPINSNNNYSNDNYSNTNTTNSTNQNKRYCSHCGKEIDINNKYCTNCGSEIIK